MGRWTTLTIGLIIAALGWIGLQAPVSAFTSGVPAPLASDSFPVLQGYCQTAVGQLGQVVLAGAAQACQTISAWIAALHAAVAIGGVIAALGLIAGLAPRPPVPVDDEDDGPLMY
jgi:hypothetical protein